MTISFPKAPPPPEETLNNPELLALVDERLSLDQTTNTWIFFDEEDEYEYNYDQQQFISRSTKSTETSTKRSREDAEIDKEEELNKMELKRLKKERLAELKQEIAQLKAQKQEKNQKDSTTAVFVSKLPDNVTKDELITVFSKFGLLAEDFATGEPRVKMYYENEVFKNEALIIYLNKESVDLAIEMLHDTSIRPNSTISVEAAQFQESTESKSAMTEEQKKLMRQKKEQMKKKLSNWDDDHKTNKFEEIKRKLFDKIVVVEGMFRPEELKQDSLLEMDLKDDIHEECEKLGIGNDITKVTIYEKKLVVTIKFVKPESSMKCIKGFDGRHFDGLKLKAYSYNGEKLDESEPSEGK